MNGATRFWLIAGAVGPLAFCLPVGDYLARVGISVLVSLAAGAIGARTSLDPARLVSALPVAWAAAVVLWVAQL